MLRPVDPDERRWAEADSILHRTPTPSARARVRGRRRVLVLGLFGVSLLGALVGATAAAHSGRHLDASGPRTWQVVVGTGCVGLAVAAVGWPAVGQFRSRLWGGAWRAPTAALTRRQRKELYAQVRGQRPADPARLPLSRDLARRLVLQRRTIALYAGLLLLWVGQTITFPDLFHLAGLGGYLVLCGVASAWTLREARRARRFLETTPSTGGDGRGP
jgi:hypothetical protein